MTLMTLNDADVIETPAGVAASQLRHLETPNKTIKNTNYSKEKLVELNLFLIRLRLD